MTKRLLAAAAVAIALCALWSMLVIIRGLQGLIRSRRAAMPAHSWPRLGSA